MVKLAESLFPCEKCPYKAKRRYNLNLHLKSIHEGVNYPCDQCGFKTTQKGSLLRHTPYNPYNILVINVTIRLNNGTIYSTIKDPYMKVSNSNIPVINVPMKQVLNRL